VCTGTVLLLPLQYSEIQFGNLPCRFRIWWEDEGLNVPPKCRYAISYCNPDLTPSVTISNQDYLVLAVTSKGPQSPTCGRDDRAIRFPLLLLYYSPPTSLVDVSEPTAFVPILRPRIEDPRVSAAQSQHPSICLLLHSPLAYTNQPQAPAVTKDYRYQVPC